MYPSGRDPLLAFRYLEFRFYVLASFLFTTAFLIQEVVIGFELYRITNDPLAIGLTGLFYALPFMGLSLVGGHLADRLSKKKLLLTSLTGMALCTALLAFFSHQLAKGLIRENDFPYIVYVLTALTGACYAFYSPTISSLRPMLVPRHAYENAATWGSTGWQAGTIVGPALSGFIYAWGNFSITLLTVLLLQITVFVLLLFIRDRKITISGTAESILKNIREGVRFVFRKKMLLYSISLDLFAVLFGGVVAILPVFAKDILHVGVEELGILRAAPSVGALLTLLVLSFVSLISHAWRMLLLNVAGFGVATLVFALSENFMLSVMALFFTGAFDAVSVVIRQTILQLLVPDEMRGRVGAVNGIFLSASNELGAFESGLAASLLGTVPSVVFGGLVSLGITGWVWWKTHKLNFTLEV